MKILIEKIETDIKIFNKDEVNKLNKIEKSGIKGLELAFLSVGVAFIAIAFAIFLEIWTPNDTSKWTIFIILLDYI